jgi:hypothetical protein
MSIARESIDIRLHDGTLWIGSRRYPLHTITRATTTEHRTDRETAVRQYAVAVSSWLFPAAIVSAVSPQAVSALVTMTVLAWFATRTSQLIRFLRTPLHELTLDTTGGRHRALVGTDPHALSDLAFRITDALNDPAMEFHTQVDRVADAHPDIRPIREEPPDRITHA